MSRRPRAEKNPANHRKVEPKHIVAKPADVETVKRLLQDVDPSEQESTCCNNGPLDGIEDDDDEEEGHEELDGAP